MPRVPIRRIIETWKASGQNLSVAASQLGIDRRTVKRWVDRGRQPWGYVRWQGMQCQSTAPSHPNKCEEVGLEHFYIHKSFPNDNAVIERNFRTDEEEFFWLEDAPQDHLELNTWYQYFPDRYNTTRPHMGINTLTPKEAIKLYRKP